VTPRRYERRRQCSLALAQDRDARHLDPNGAGLPRLVTWSGALISPDRAPELLVCDGGERLPGVDRSTTDRIVLHVDMDCFYAACERLREPELAGEPLVVGMGYAAGESHGAVATASYEAREFGVETAMPISQALERLPRQAVARDDPDLDAAEAGYYRPVDMDFYRSVSDDVRTILEEVADVVRAVSIDEAYLDVTEQTDWSVADGFARHVKDRPGDAGRPRRYRTRRRGSVPGAAPDR